MHFFLTICSSTFSHHSMLTLDKELNFRFQNSHRVMVDDFTIKYQICYNNIVWCHTAYIYIIYFFFHFQRFRCMTPPINNPQFCTQFGICHLCENRRGAFGNPVWPNKDCCCICGGQVANMFKDDEHSGKYTTLLFSLILFWRNGGTQLWFG